MPRPVSVRVASLSLGPTGRSDPDARRAPLDVGDFACGPVPVFTDPGASAASRVRKLRYVDPPAAAPGPGEAAAPEGHAPFPAGRPIVERGPWADLGAGAVAHQAWSKPSAATPPTPPQRQLVPQARQHAAHQSAHQRQAALRTHGAHCRAKAIALAELARQERAARLDRPHDHQQHQHQPNQHQLQRRQQKAYASRRPASASRRAPEPPADTRTRFGRSETAAAATSGLGAAAAASEPATACADRAAHSRSETTRERSAEGHLPARGPRDQQDPEPVSGSGLEACAWGLVGQPSGDCAAQQLETFDPDATLTTADPIAEQSEDDRAEDEHTTGTHRALAAPEQAEGRPKHALAEQGAESVELCSEHALAFRPSAAGSPARDRAAAGVATFARDAAAAPARGAVQGLPAGWLVPGPGHSRRAVPDARGHHVHFASASAPVVDGSAEEVVMPRKAASPDARRLAERARESRIPVEWQDYPAELRSLDALRQEAVDTEQRQRRVERLSAAAAYAASDCPAHRRRLFEGAVSADAAGWHPSCDAAEAARGGPRKRAVATGVRRQPRPRQPKWSVPVIGSPRLPVDPRLRRPAFTEAEAAYATPAEQARQRRHRLGLSHH